MDAVMVKISRYRDIILYRTIAGVKAESRQNYLGYLWYVLEPLLTTIIFYLAFAKLMGRGGKEYVMFLLIGLISWQWFESSCLQAAGSIKVKLHILQHFDLPKFLFPIVAILINTWKFLCIYLVSIGTAVFLGFSPGLNYLYLPLVLGCELLLIISLSIPLAISATYFNDTLTLAGAVFRILFFVSGIYFDASKVPASLQTAFYANPMAGIIESYRHVLLAGTPPNLPALAYCALLSGCLLVPGLMLCHYVDRRILKHVCL